MASKRKCAPSTSQDETPISKRRRTSIPDRTSRDILSTLSDELLLRILGLLNETTLLSAIAPVSRHFHRLAGDSQLWRAHYYRRFVLPRALRIPGFKPGNGAAHGIGARTAHLQVQRRTADVRPGGGGVDWKRQYKLRHNWARGSCAVDEVNVSVSTRDAAVAMGDGEAPRRTLVKVVEGIAVTVDVSWGLRVWSLRTRRLIARSKLLPNEQPTSISADEETLDHGFLDIMIGFGHGGFGVWRLDIGTSELSEQYRHKESSNGELAAVAYSFPYALTATQAGLISLYTFDRPSKTVSDSSSTTQNSPTEAETENDDVDYYDTDRSETPQQEPGNKTSTAPHKLPPPYLLTSLKSHSSRSPLALSIRKLSSSVSASIAYTFDTRNGWSIGIQDILIRVTGSSTEPQLTSRLASTLPITPSEASPQSSPSPSDSPLSPTGPTTLCYSHPYLLATLPDNTLVLYLCTSTASSLSLSPGIRLWGHTSGISDAEITPRGKAVSVSTRGDEIRVWELEGRVGGSSVEVKPSSRHQGLDDDDDNDDDEPLSGRSTPTLDGNLDISTPAGKGGVASGFAAVMESPGRADWEDRRNWVGFDDEMVIVLKEARDGRESLMVYDFT